jgi:hypothetical protein
MRTDASFRMAMGCAIDCDASGRVTPPDSTQNQPPTGTSKEPKELLLGKDGGAPPHPRSQPDLKAREPHIDIAEVIGSIPIAPTIVMSHDIVDTCLTTSLTTLGFGPDLVPSGW